MKVNMVLLYYLAVILLVIYPNEPKTYVQINTCTLRYIRVLFLIDKTWKQPRYPSVDEWIHKQWYPDNAMLFITKKK